MQVEDSGAVIAIVDDDSDVMMVLEELLTEFGFSRVLSFNNAFDALEGYDAHCFDVVITDFKMPGMDGLEFLKQLQKRDRLLPVILMTGYADMDRAVEAFKHGAFDFVVKPFKPYQLLHELNRALATRRLSKLEQDYKEELEKRVWERTQELNRSLDKMLVMNREIIHRLGIAAELRDDETGSHIARIVYYVSRLATLLGQDEEQAHILGLASTMHDIGKIGIPDALLFKKGPLDSSEFEIIKTHTTIGERILSESSFEILDVAAAIAASHHEKWNGTGYPHGLLGEDIPLGGRIVILADQYDALRSERPYKPSFSHEKTCDIILKGDGRTHPDHFDPRILEVFADNHAEFDRIFIENQRLNFSAFSGESARRAITKSC